MGKSKAGAGDPSRRIVDFFAATSQQPQRSKMAPLSPRSSRAARRGSQSSASSTAAADLSDAPVTAALLRDMLGDLRTSVQEDMRSMMAELRGEVEELGGCMDHLENKMSELVASHSDLWEAHDNLQLLVTKTHAETLDLEDRSRRNNVKLRGIAEKVGADDLRAFLQDFVISVLPLYSKDDIVIDQIDWRQLAKSKHDIICLQETHLLEQDNVRMSPGGYNAKDYDKILEKTSITLYSIVFTLGIIGNGLVIWIAGFRMKNTISTVWFLHLAIADFLCCSSLPLRIADWAVYFSYQPHFAYCIVNFVLFNVNMSASVLLLTAMSIDRWVSVMWPFWAKVHRSRNLVRISAAIIWGLSFTVAGALYYVYRYHVGDLGEWCLYYYSRYPYNPQLHETTQWIRFIIMCVIPFLIIVTSYVTIFYKLRKRRRSQRSQRSSRIITAVISCFFICWFPYYTWQLIHWYYKYYIKSSYKVYITFYYWEYITPRIVRTFITSLACLNSCLNPIIYVFLTPDFQHGFLRSIPSRLERAFGDHPNDLSRERGDTGDTRPTAV
ncbi:formyl peptide receptor 2-like [Ranitomeya imitator]|uniref:formyl peptide receptor 2-like n=1 Tax=Ranitomeya imitator TaxID=111125 RepID=UPI0037E83195